MNLFLAGGFRDPKQFSQEMLDTLPQFEKDLQEFQKRAALMPVPPANSNIPPPIPLAIQTGEQKYTQIKCPVLAIFADPHDLGSMVKDDTPAVRAAVQASDLASTTAQAKAFGAGIPSAHVIIIPNADHYVFNSNEADVLREMNAFIASLPPAK